MAHPEHAASIQRVLAIPAKRFERNLVVYLTDQEVDALVGACDRRTWTGRRDHAMVVLAVQTGLRISELARLTVADITLGTGAHVYTVGKGRKERRAPLVPQTVAVLRSWLNERQGAPVETLFPTSTGRPLSRDAIERRVALHASKAAASCPSIGTKHVTAHTLRHTAAMRLLLSGVEVTVIALWLGHEQVSTTNIYLTARPEDVIESVLAHHRRRADESARPDPEPSSAYRPDARGKSSAGSDIVEVRYVDIVSNVQVVQAVDFVSDNPEFAGAVTMTWAVTAVDGGTRVDITADDVPDGISDDDHATGLTSSLENLSSYVES